MSSRSRRNLRFIDTDELVCLINRSAAVVVLIPPVVVREVENRVVCLRFGGVLTDDQVQGRLKPLHSMGSSTAKVSVESSV